VLGYSKKNNVVFILRAKEASDIASPKVKVDTRLLQMDKVTPLQWRELKQLQGQFDVLYLRLRYGSPNTYILLAYVEESLAHVEWIVPASRIKSRYSFVSEGSHTIISCLTASCFRGLGIYPAQLGRVIKSAIPSDKYWIWTTSDNTSSIKGIQKAGGIKVLEFVQEKLFWGCISHIEYLPEESHSK